MAFLGDQVPPHSVIPVDYFSVTDPALDVNNHVAKGKRWLKTDNVTTPTWLESYIRNPDNDDWILLWTRGNLTAPAQGDILVTDANGRMVALGIGANGTALVSNGTTLAYTAVATQAAIDAAIAGLSWKESVRVATTAAGTLASDFENGDTVDGVALATGDRILIKNQAAGAENGIYTVNASGAPTRATDADSADDILQASVYVQAGTTNADTQWVLTTNAPITLDTTALTFTQLAAGAGGTVDIEDEGAAEGAADTIDFVGAGVSVTFAAGKATVTVPGGGGGGLVFLDEQVASASATLDFTSIIDDTYDEYEIHCVNMVPATDNVLFEMQFSTDNGSSWIATNYHYAGLATFTSGFNGVVNHTTATALRLGGALGNGTGEHFNVVVRLGNMRGALYKSASWIGHGYSQDPLAWIESTMGLHGTTTAVDAIRLKMSSGNITSGVARLYGIAKA